MYKKVTCSPSNDAIRMANTKFPPQESKAIRIKGFSENISQLSLCLDEFHFYVTLLPVVSQEMMSHIYVFHSTMENWVFG